MNSRLRRATVYTLCLGIALLMPMYSYGQAVYGSIIGTVTDPQGAAVPGAKVTVTNVAQGISNDVTTNDTGNYSVTHLIPGSYAVKFEGKGFKTQEQKGITVFADVAARVDNQFQVGQ